MKRDHSAAAMARHAGLEAVMRHPVLATLAAEVSFIVDTNQQFVAAKGWIAVSPSGYVYLHPKRRALPAAWSRLIGIAVVCLGFGLVRRQEPSVRWELACLLVANRFCDELKLGAWPNDLFVGECDFPSGGAEGLLRQFCVAGCAPALLEWFDAVCGGAPLFCRLDEVDQPWERRPKWRELLADGIATGVGQALAEVGGVAEAAPKRLSAAAKAKRSLIDRYPLLGALAASFDIEEDPRLCQLHDIRIGAIDVGARRIWINPAAGLTESECLFVLAHELLHAGLNHASRRRGRDPLLWNIACDFVINGWLLEMGVGSAPNMGLLHDAAFAGRSSEEIYDTLAQDIRRARKLATLRGAGAQDLLGADEGAMFTDAEAYCRRALAQGLDRYSMGGARGLLPAGLVEEIRSLSQPPIPWDVRLAHWFDERFPPPEPRRSYARPSRRQSATPDIARPSVVKPGEEERLSRVFGVVLDTSGSMDNRLLGKALGAIASYAMAREVAAVRLICCDAEANDSGWIEPERLLDRVSVRGRGGTVLQPGLDRLHELARQTQFPQNGPVLVITDGYCESKLSTSMDHAYLLPEGRRLPFPARGEVFSLK
ncbi:MAG: VWA-like domain-containing protein [Pseudomonadota bacterium]